MGKVRPSVRYQRGMLSFPFLSFKRILFIVALSVVLSSATRAQAPAPPAPAQPHAPIQSIEFRGNRRVPTATLRARVRSKQGDLYDENVLRGDFMALYNTGLFEDITLRVEDGDKGKIIVFEVKEKPTIRSIEYKGNKSVSQSDILDRFKERKVGLSVESRFDPTAVKKATVVLKQLLAEHGRQQATVTLEQKEIPPSSVGLTFNIDEGPKVKVGKIAFQGNKNLDDKTLVRAMHNSRPYGIPYSRFFENIISKTFDKDKLDEDLEGIREAYQEHGYYKAVVNDPKLTTRLTPAGMHIWLVKSGKPGQRVDILIPVLEGDRYHLGEMTFKGSTIIKDPDKSLRPLFQMNEGDIFNVSKIRKGLEQLRKVYGEFGYINFVASPDTDVDDQQHKIDMVFNLDEGKQFTVRRIDFSGNTTTRDKVIRRELLLQEGSLFNSRLWELSILRLNQLNYFQKLDPAKDATVTPDNRTGTVDLTLNVKENGKNSIGFSGGVSGLAGSFVGANYTSNNFLGLGETLTLEAQFGSIQRNILLGLTHPYAFDRPLQLGGTVYSRRYNFNQSQQASIFAGQNLAALYNLLGSQNIQNYSQSSDGLTLFASYPLHNNFSRLGLTYGYDISKVETFSNISELLFESLDFNGLNGANALSGIHTSTVTPTYTFSTIDNPMDEKHGKSYFGSVQFAGVGGNVRTYRPTLDFKWFHPAGGNRTFGIHWMGSTTNGWGGRVVPPFSRFYSGGETDIRGFDFYTITPVGFLPNTGSLAVLNSNGTPRTTTSLNQIGQQTESAQTMTVPIMSIITPGGDTESVLNMEYRIPLIGPVWLTIFSDLGINMALYRSQLTLTDSALQSLTSQFPDNNFNRTIQLAPGTNFQPRMSTGIELGVLLPIVRAPFRVYWAYNPLRLETNLSPASIANPALFPNSATYESYIENFGSPRAYAERAATFRFTVGRTF